MKTILAADGKSVESLMAGVAAKRDQLAGAA